MFETGNDGKSPLCEPSYIPDIESRFLICDHTVTISEPVHVKGFLKPVLLLIKIFFLNNVLHTSRRIAGSQYVYNIVDSRRKTSLLDNI